MITPRTMPGVLELLPAEQIAFQSMMDSIRRGFEAYGFLPIETPAIELSEILLTKTGGETERQMYFVQSTGAIEQGRTPDLALRFDLTVPLARYVAEHEGRLSFPFRRYQLQRVYRGESPQRGRFREFYQCDIDVIGKDKLDIRHDAEIPAVISTVFTALEIGDFTIRINNRKLMRGLLERAGVRDAGVQTAALREIDKLDKRGSEAVTDALEGLGLTGDRASELLETIGRRSSGYAEADQMLAEIPPDNDSIADGARELTLVMESIQELGVPEAHVAIDLSIARGLDYYTGTVYETVLDDHPGVGSVCSGGRYDDLASQYTKSRLPGVGISIGLTRLFWQLRDLGIVGEQPTTVDVLVALMDESDRPYALKIAALLREAGINVESVLSPAKLGKQIKQADRTGVRFVVIAGEDERSRGVAALKDLVRQTQIEIELEHLSDHIDRSK